MVKGAHIGYIWFIKDPRLPADKNIIYVGNGVKPWESVSRHLRHSSNPEVFKWAMELTSQHPEGFEILGKVVAERWEGDFKPLPPQTAGVTRIEWGILDYEAETFDDSDTIQVARTTRKNYWIERLRAEGHPLMNGKAGRPWLKDL